MSTSEDLIVEDGGKITLPEAVREQHYGLSEDTPLRVIETRGGILLVPLTREPMSDGLRSELEEWQALGSESLELFPYEE